MFKVCVLLVALIATVVCTPTGSSEKHDKPGYCNYKGVHIKEGEYGAGPIGECMRVKCDRAEPGKMAVSGVGCGTFLPRKGCHLSDYDLTVRYPDCCAKEVCPE